MSMRDLIPWGRQSSAAPMHYQGQDDPLTGFRREVDRLFDDFFRSGLQGLRGGGPGRGLGLGGLGALASWPNVELSESDGEVRITAEAPGLNEKDIELLLDDGVLVLRGEKKSEVEDQNRGYSERSYGRFERRIALPAGVDEQGAKAVFKDGLLTITLPRSPEAERGRRIPINAETRH